MTPLIGKALVTSLAPEPSLWALLPKPQAWTGRKEEDIDANRCYGAWGDLKGRGVRAVSAQVGSDPAFHFALSVWVFFSLILIKKNYCIKMLFISVAEFQIRSDQSLSRVQCFAAPWTAACQVSGSCTITQRLLKLASIESVMPSNHIILCCSLLLLPPVPPSIRVFSNESALCLRWPKYWSFSFSPSSKYSRLI